MRRYTIGLDFGTLSCRAVLVDVHTGEEVSSSVMEYPHAVMHEALPDGTPLGIDWALQHPQDYLDVLAAVVPQALGRAGADAGQVIGVGVDFTACTLLPVRADGTPLCLLEGFRSNPHAYAKLWNHHAAQQRANRINEVASERGEAFLARYGGKTSSEWMLPKLWETLDEAPEVYEAAGYFIEAADWIVWQLTGVQTRSAGIAGYKAMWSRRDGYPSEEFFRAVDPRLEHLAQQKLNAPVSPLGSKAGEICERGAALTGLHVGTAVAVGNIDAHVTLPAVKVTGPGRMLAIMGTSTCHLVMGREERTVPGSCGVVEDGGLPGYFCYEAGQSCVGDHFAWLTGNCLPPAYWEEARARGLSIHACLREKAGRLRPGESGLLALDWWNGNRSVLVDVDLTGMMLGMTLQTRPEEIYRALIEATAYGTRMIIEAFREQGVAVEEFCASGGISQKDPMAMQIYADVINMPVLIGGSQQGPALGSAIFGAVAAGSGRGGYDSVAQAAQVMGKLRDQAYLPDPEAVRVYDRLYEEYRRLHDYFGRGGNDVMKRLKEIKRNARSQRG